MSDNASSTATTLDTLIGRYLLFLIDNVIYGAPLSLVLEIIQIQTITHLPGVAPYVKGIVNLRGKVVPVIDVRMKFNLPNVPYDDNTCIVVLEIRGMQIGLIVDSVSEVVSIDNDSLAQPPDVGNTFDRYLSSIAELGDRVVLNIDFELFFQDDF